MQQSTKSHAITSMVGILLGAVLTLTTQGLFPGAEREGDDSPAGQRSGGEASRPNTAPGLETTKSRHDPRSAKSKTKQRPELISARDAVTAGQFDRALIEWADQTRQQQRGIGERQIELRLAFWIEQIGLSEAQAAAVEAVMVRQLEERLQNIGKEWSDPADDDASQEAELVDSLEALLSDQQKELYAEMQDQQQWNEIEADATRRLADLQTKLDLSEEQKDRMFEIFHAQESARRQAAPAAKTNYQAFIEAGGTPQTWREHRQELARAQRETQLEQVRDILSERQLEAYRDILRRSGRRLDTPLGRNLLPIIPK